MLVLNIARLVKKIEEELGKSFDVMEIDPNLSYYEATSVLRQLLPKRAGILDELRFAERVVDQMVQREPLEPISREELAQFREALRILQRYKTKLPKGPTTKTLLEHRKEEIRQFLLLGKNWGGLFPDTKTSRELIRRKLRRKRK